MILLLLTFSEASLGLLRRVSWAAQALLKTLEKALLELPDSSGRAAALWAALWWLLGSLGPSWAGLGVFWSVLDAEFKSP